MLADSYENMGSGQLTDGVIPDATIQAVLDFIEFHFSDFAQKVKGELSASEKALTDKLCKFLNRRAAGYPFHFHHENVENHASGRSATVDLGIISQIEEISIGDKVYGEFDSFFSIEAKRLPTLGNNREKEYVVGHSTPCGGIERFKKGIHGGNLKCAAVIGYIQAENADYWFLKVNQWIEELSLSESTFWHANEEMIQVPSDFQLYKYSSEHIRIVDGKSDNIKLFHFWIHLL